MLSFFVSDLHGRPARYHLLLELARREKPRGIFLGGDLLPHYMDTAWQNEPGQTDFLRDFLWVELRRLRADLGGDYPQVFLIPGNDDPRCVEEEFETAQAEGLISYVQGRRALYGEFPVYGYACIPPSPFQLKDWERYDVSRFVDPGCSAPDEGLRTAGPPEREIRFTTIAGELAELTGDADLADAICLFHCPPYGCKLDRAALDGKQVDHVPLDVHIGSIAIQRFIAARQPLLTLHGHVHESFTLTGAWQERFGRTLSCSAATEREDLALVRFDPHHPAAATRQAYGLEPSGSS